MKRIKEMFLGSCRVVLKSGLLFSAMRPSDSALWEMLLEPGQGQSSNMVSVVCQRKLAGTAKRSVNIFSRFFQTWNQ